ncbi:PE/PPE C-terminal domain-containing protein [Mycobacterium botniense]|nr:PE/PPE C-terminal domain-containing protein [Mycobacterium botniense]
MQVSNFGSAASDLLQLGSAGFITGGAPGAETLGSAGVGAPLLAGAVGSASHAGIGAEPVVVGLGRASSVGGLSVPPSWAGEPGAAGPAPATLAGAGWTAAPPTPPVSTMPAGMPSVAAAGKAAGLGAPRYGVKPTVMPKPAVV